MRRTGRFFGFLGVLFTLGIGSGSQVWAEVGQAAGAKPQIAPWAAYFYVAAANDLEPEAWTSLLQIIRSRPSPKTPVVALFHVLSKKEVFLLNLSQVTSPQLAEINGTAGKADFEKLLQAALVEKWPDKDLGDGATLRQYLEWAHMNFPAKRSALIYWGHGNAWRGFAYEATDTGFKHRMRFPEFREALTRLQVEGLSFEWVAFDACSIGIVEVAYELRDVAPYVIASTYEVPAYSYPYDQLFAIWNPVFQATGDMPPPRSMAITLVEEYGKAYSESAPALPKDDALEPFKLVAIDTSKLGPVADFFKKLASQISMHQIGATRWFQGLQESISSYDAVADVDALLYYLSLNLRDLEPWLREERELMGFRHPPDSVDRMVHLTSDSATQAHVSISVVPDRYSSKEARRALSALNHGNSFHWAHSPSIMAATPEIPYDRIEFDVELANADYRGDYSMSFDPFVLGSHAVDIKMAGEDKVQHLERSSDRVFRQDFPPLSPLIAETHGAEFPEFRSLGVLFTNYISAYNISAGAKAMPGLSGDPMSGLSSYRELQWERDTGWGAALLNAWSEGEK